MVTGQRVSLASAGILVAASVGGFSPGAIGRPITVSVL